MIIGIEGPAGSGKSTMANTVAAEMGMPVVEGGIWYRALTFLALQEGLAPEQTEALVAKSEDLNIDFIKGEDGKTRMLVNGQPASAQMYGEEVSRAVGSYAGNLEVRAVIMPKIAEKLHELAPVIIVGRHLLKISPDIKVLSLTIDETEADRRHFVRAGEGAYSVSERNEQDRRTASLLKVDSHGMTTVDVTHLGQEEQAEVLRQFIASQRVGSRA